jgi:hypothetical protein
MNRVAHMVIFFCIAVSGKIALSQSSACANPNATRIALVILNQPAANDPASSPQLAALSKRLVDAAARFRDQLAQRLPANACIVTSLEIFEDPKNYPRLKGSPMIEISADASFKNPSVFALAVTVSSAGGIYARDDFRMFTIPVLIETDSDFARGADGLMKFWQGWVEAATHGPNK